MADKISGNLKSYLDTKKYDWKKDPHALEILGDFVGESKLRKLIQTEIRKVLKEEDDRIKQKKIDTRKVIEGCDIFIDVLKKQITKNNESNN